MDKAIIDSEDEFLHHKNNNNINKYQSGQLTGAVSNISPPSTTTGTTGSGGSKNPSAPVQKQNTCF